MGGRRILPPAYLLASVLCMIALRYTFPGPRLLEAPLSLAGAVPLVGGIMVVLLAAREFRRRETTIKPFQESSVLITNGLYSISRNPIYVCFTLILIGTALMLGVVSPWLVIPVFVFVINRIFIPVEEAMLRDKFGAEWEAYSCRVRRWI